MWSRACKYLMREGGGVEVNMGAGRGKARNVAIRSVSSDRRQDAYRLLGGSVGSKGTYTYQDGNCGNFSCEWLEVCTCNERLWHCITHVDTCTAPPSPDRIYKLSARVYKLVVQ